jgi:hypothetical protein
MVSEATDDLEEQILESISGRYQLSRLGGRLECSQKAAYTKRCDGQKEQ